MSLDQGHQGPEGLQLACKDAILALFPDICRDHLDKVTQEAKYNSELVIYGILERQDNGEPYPKQPKATSLKRKRDPDEELDDTVRVSKKFDNEERRREPKAMGYMTMAKLALMQAFPRIPCKELHGALQQHGNCLFPAYLAMNKLMVEGHPRFRMKKAAAKGDPRFEDAIIERTIRLAREGEKEALEEFRAARTVIRAEKAKREVDERRGKEEAENLEKARVEGAIADCQCCFVETPINRMVQCNNDSNPHSFCRDCARRMAEAQIGLSKYTLTCMSTEGCTSGFSMSQRGLFLDANLQTALERIEQEDNLRLAGIENLETCPFCQFAAEYPPAEENKEFRCQNPSCEVTSCRLCRRETHIPQTCDQAARDEGSSARLELEEARSAAIIRKCSKCGTPFIKESGCNKMTCTRSGCGNVQCYVCHATCDYAHFDDTRRGGKKGNCPLFDVNIESRHDGELLAAEEKARKKIVDAHPGLDVEMLQIKLSDKVKQDDERRKQPARLEHQPIYGLPGEPLPIPRLGRLAGVHAAVGLAGPAGFADVGGVNPNPVPGVVPGHIEAMVDYGARVGHRQHAVPPPMPQLPLLPPNEVPDYVRDRVGRAFCNVPLELLRRIRRHRQWPQPEAPAPQVIEAQRVAMQPPKANPALFGAYKAHRVLAGALGVPGVARVPGGAAKGPAPVPPPHRLASVAVAAAAAAAKPGAAVQSEPKRHEKFHRHDLNHASLGSRALPIDLEVPLPDPFYRLFGLPGPAAAAGAIPEGPGLAAHPAPHGLFGANMVHMGQPRGRYHYPVEELKQAPDPLPLPSAAILQPPTVNPANLQLHGQMFLNQEQFDSLPAAPFQQVPHIMPVDFNFQPLESNHGAGYPFP